MSSVTTSYTINIVCLFVLDLKNEEGGEEMDTRKEGYILCTITINILIFKYICTYIIINDGIKELGLIQKTSSTGYYYYYSWRKSLFNVNYLKTKQKRKRFNVLLLSLYVFGTSF